MFEKDAPSSAVASLLQGKVLLYIVLKGGTQCGCEENTLGRALDAFSMTHHSNNINININNATMRQASELVPGPDAFDKMAYPGHVHEDVFVPARDEGFFLRTRIQ